MTALPARPHPGLTPRSLALIGLVSTLPLPSLAADVADGGLLEVQKAWAIAHAGRAVFITDDLAIVFHPETNSAWLESGSDILDTGTLVVMGDEPRLAIQWHSGETIPLPPTLPTPDQVSATRSPVAELYDQLMAKPLASAIPPLPAGSRFEPHGVLRLPVAGATSVDAVSADAPQSGTIGLWQARGSLIAISLDGQSLLLPLADLAKAVSSD